MTIINSNIRYFSTPGSLNEHGPRQPQLGIPSHDPRVHEQHRVPAAHRQRACGRPSDHRVREKEAP